MSGVQFTNNRLRQLRQERNLTLRALSEKTGVVHSTISLCESGKRNFSANTIKALSDFFGVSVDYLLGISPEENLTAKDMVSAEEPQKAGASYKSDLKTGNPANGQINFLEVFNMNDARTRAEQELNELSEKIAKLSSFLFSTKSTETITSYMQHLMQDQLEAMQRYAMTLRERLRVWDMSEEEIWQDRTKKY